MIKQTAVIGPYSVSLLLPQGVGHYADPNGKIWRSVSPSYAFFIKVFPSEYPKDPAAAREQLFLDEGQKLISENSRDNGYEIVVEEPEGQHQVHVWIKRGPDSVICSGFLGKKLGDREMVEKSNRWIYKICSSIEFVEP